LAQVLQQVFPWCAQWEPQLRQLFGAYALAKQRQNLLDYDDLLLFWAEIMADPQLGPELGARFDHVLVDEYQDTNRLQSAIVRGLKPSGQGLTVVGDDAQSIYSFRGATIRNILDFPVEFPGTTIVALEENYRSTQPILDTSNVLISRAGERYSKSLYTKRTGGDRPWLVTAQDEPTQTRFVVDRILELHEEGTPLREMAVLFRAGYHSADLEIELTARNIPFDKWGGLKFLEAAHVKDVLAFLRVLENPRDEVSWYRLLLLMPGIGDVTARNAMELMAQHAWTHAAFGKFQPPPRARAAHTALVALLDALRHGAPDGEGAVARDIARVRVLYDDILREKYDRPDPRLADLDQLQVIAGAVEVVLRRETTEALRVSGDPDRVRQLLLNLIDNAIKYTPPRGQVTVRVAQEAGWACVEVRDTGPGIPLEHLQPGPNGAPLIFERFYRVEKSRARVAALDSGHGRPGSGTGLGLSIAHWIVQSHAGRIDVRSAPGEGATFTVWLPLRTAEVVTNEALPT
ncbi:MAG: ATP-binding protein, partial [Deltaproteobacteria bacterium]